MPLASSCARHTKKRPLREVPLFKIIENRTAPLMNGKSDRMFNGGGKSDRTFNARKI